MSSSWCGQDVGRAICAVKGRGAKGSTATSVAVELEVGRLFPRKRGGLFGRRRCPHYLAGVTAAVAELLRQRVGHGRFELVGVLGPVTVELPVGTGEIEVLLAHRGVNSLVRFAKPLVWPDMHRRDETAGRRGLCGSPSQWRRAPGPNQAIAFLRFASRPSRKAR